jgi:hypothetical protein
MFTSSVIQIYNGSNKTSGLIQSATQLELGFQRLDKEVRYASNVFDPVQSNGSWYVEFKTGSYTPYQCTQVRLTPVASGGVLQQRIWTSTAAVAPGWQALSSGLAPSAASGGVPFAVVGSADDLHPKQRLTIAVTATSGPSNFRTNSDMTTTFSAVNSGTASGGTSLCATWGRP